MTLTEAREIVAKGDALKVSVINGSGWYPYFEAKGFLEGHKAVLEEVFKIVDDELDSESDNDDDQRGHLKSMHIGAMDALSNVLERIMELKSESLEAHK